MHCRAKESYPIKRKRFGFFMNQIPTTFPLQSSFYHVLNPKSFPQRTSPKTNLKKPQICLKNVCTRSVKNPPGKVGCVSTKKGPSLDKPVDKTFVKRERF